jgi:hypothetical protein
MGRKFGWLPFPPVEQSRVGSRVVFEAILCIEGTTEKYQTLILNIRPGNTPKPVITIGFPEDFGIIENAGRAKLIAPDLVFVQDR